MVVRKSHVSRVATDQATSQSMPLSLQRNILLADFQIHTTDCLFAFHVFVLFVLCGAKYFKLRKRSFADFGYTQ